MAHLSRCDDRRVQSLAWSIWVRVASVPGAAGEHVFPMLPGRPRHRSTHCRSVYTSSIYRHRSRIRSSFRSPLAAQSMAFCIAVLRRSSFHFFRIEFRFLIFRFILDSSLHIDLGDRLADRKLDDHGLSVFSLTRRTGRQERTQTGVSGRAEWRLSLFCLPA